MKDFSCGIIPYRLTNQNQVEILLVHHQKGHWAFPKGHPEGDEQPLDTALRELKEETNLTASVHDPDQSFQEMYWFTNPDGQKTHKTVQFFLGEVQPNQETKILEAEVQDAAWVPIEEVRDKLTYPASKRVFDECQPFLTNLKQT